MSEKEIQRVAVIGAGIGGICSAKYLSAQPNFQPTVFERYDRIGGQWAYTEQTGIDSEDGLPVVSGIYKSMHTNIPKYLMQFPDFPYDDDAPQFLPHAEVLKYINKYATHFDLHQYIKLKTVVELVEPIHSDTKTSWKVSVKDLRTGHRYTDVFDAVMVCIGSFTTPHFPPVKGEETFPGRILHSHDYRQPEDFPKDSTVVCLGAGLSAQDIVVDLSPRCKTVFLSHRDEKLVAPFPSNVPQVPVIKSIDGSKVTFADGQECEADVIIKCTGYNYSFPFLAPECNVNYDTRHISPIYKYTVHMDYPSLSFIGLLSQTLPFPQYSCLIRFVIGVLNGTVKLPTREEMKQDAKNNLQRRLDLGWPKHWENCAGAFFTEMNNELADLANFERLPRYIESLNEELIEQRRVNICHYRKNKYKIIDSERWCRVQHSDDVIQNGDKNGHVRKNGYTNGHAVLNGHSKSPVANGFANGHDINYNTMRKIENGFANGLKLENGCTDHDRCTNGYSGVDGIVNGHEVLVNGQ